MEIERIEDALAEPPIRGRLHRPDGAPRGPLRIGSLETTAALRLSPLFAGYATTWPEVDLSVTPGTTAELIDAVLEQSEHFFSQPLADRLAAGRALS
mgnify:CR=1 FL=1